MESFLNGKSTTLLEVTAPGGTFYSSLGCPYTGTPKRCTKNPFGGFLGKKPLLRTLIWGSFLNHKFSASNNHLGFFIAPCGVHEGFLTEPIGFHITALP